MSYSTDSDVTLKWRQDKDVGDNKKFAERIIRTAKEEEITLHKLKEKLEEKMGIKVDIFFSKGRNEVHEQRKDFKNMDDVPDALVVKHTNPPKFRLVDVENCRKENEGIKAKKVWYWACKNFEINLRDKYEIPANYLIDLPETLNTSLDFCMAITSFFSKPNAKLAILHLKFLKSISKRPSYLDWVGKKRLPLKDTDNIKWVDWE